MENKKKSSILSFIMIIASLISLLANIKTSERIEFNELEAKNMLQEVYKPLEDFNRSLIDTEDEGLLLVPDNIGSEADFINLFNNKVKSHVPKSFYKDLMIERDGKLYVDALVYIPNIYSDSGRVRKAYIEKKKSLFHTIFGGEYEEDEKLMIRESWKVSGEWAKRSNYFSRNEKGEWVLLHANGISRYRFVNVNNNPWSQNR